LGGSGTGVASVTAANIQNLFSVAARKLDFYSVPQTGRVAVIGPRLLEILRQYVGGRETGFGEMVSANGVIGNRFGFELVLSENLPFTAVVTINDSEYMTKRTRTAIAKWIRKQADFFEEHHDEIAKKFTARYFRGK